LSNACAVLKITQEPDQPAISLAVKEEILRKEAAAAEEKKKEEAAVDHLLKGRRLFMQGDFEGSLRENQTIVSFYHDRSSAEEALFMLGLIHIHPANPKKEFGKSFDLMKRLVKEYPNSIFTQQAKAWIGIFQLNEKISKENEKLIKEYEKLIKVYEKLSKMLEEYKQVDIEIEEKKREKGR
jgi:outer membrane protein assembly factor BamD (BamD/ComL family)